MKIVVLVHRIFTDKGIKPGGIDYMTSYLQDKGFETTFVEHPLAGKHNSLVRTAPRIQEYKIPFSGLSRWVLEFLFNIIKVLRIKQVKLIIAVDPLNFVSAFVIGRLTQTPIQFHAVDYSEKRFSSWQLNNLYKKLYFFSLRHADFVTYVSANMRELVESHTGSPDKAIFLPNSPEFDKAPRIPPDQKQPTELIYTKSAISSTELILLAELAERLVPIFHDLKLNVIGDYPKECKPADLSRALVLHGLVDYQTNLGIMAKSSIGIAWYENIRSFEKYADSLKIREYAASGLPVVCNRNISTAIEAKEKGLLILCDNVNELTEAITQLIQNKKLYLTMREKALAWARYYDKSALLTKLYKKVGLI